MEPNPLPVSLQFFGLGWWVLHVVLIGFVYMAGFKAGKRKGMKMAGEAPGASEGGQTGGEGGAGGASEARRA